MKKQTGRNDFCPCGSGKKYKHCCLSRDDKLPRNQAKTIFRFEPGSYGDKERFTPSLACMKSAGKYEWDYHFILVKPESIHTDEDLATSEATTDIAEAFKIKEAQGSDEDLAMVLVKKGYLKVDDFKIVARKEFNS
jgi:hypothetical protein